MVSDCWGNRASTYCNHSCEKAHTGGHRSKVNACDHVQVLVCALCWDCDKRSRRTQEASYGAQAPAHQGTAVASATAARHPYPGHSASLPSAMDQHLVFRVTIHEGVNFGRELQALVCHVTLGDSTRSTAFSVERGKHSFSSTPLQWITSSAHWRRLTSSGQFICRVTVLKKTSSAKLKGSPADQDLTRLGWVVLDLRQAKLNKNYSKDHGACARSQLQGRAQCTISCLRCMRARF